MQHQLFGESSLIKSIKPIKEEQMKKVRKKEKQILANFPNPNPPACPHMFI